MPPYPNGSPVAAPPALVRARFALLGTFFIAALTYFAWRCSVVNPQAPVFSYVVLALELLAFMRIALGFSAIVRIPQRSWQPARAGRSVDVFITTVDEPLEIVRAAVRAASELIYPHTTWLLDDGDRPAMRALAIEHGCRYLARRGRADAKAGNLNHALAHATGEFVAIFDADHIADPAFLDRTLGYFRDARVAVVQTPNEFRNTDSFDHFVRGRPKTIQGAFHYGVQGARDAINATVFCGSAAVLRRSALDTVGGFATGTINEDIHTTLRLHANGFATAFHAEVLATGIAAPDAPSADRQRLRWAEDAVQLVTRARVLTHGGLTLGQRKSYAFHVVSNLEGWRYAVIYALPIAMLVWGVLPVATTARAFVCFSAPYVLLATLTSIELSRGHARPFESAVYNLARTPIAFVAPFAAFAHRAFVVTPKVRTPSARSPFAFFPWLVALAGTAAILLAVVRLAAGTSTLSLGAVVVVSAWAAYHVAVAIRLIALQRRCAGPGIPAAAAREPSLAALRAADRGDSGGILGRWFAPASVDADVPHHIEIAS